MDTQSLEVLAPPTFIESLKPYTGQYHTVPYDSEDGVAIAIKKKVTRP